MRGQPVWLCAFEGAIEFLNGARFGFSGRAAHAVPQNQDNDRGRSSRVGLISSPAPVRRRGRHPFPKARAQAGCLHEGVALIDAIDDAAHPATLLMHVTRRGDEHTNEPHRVLYYRIVNHTFLRIRSLIALPLILDGARRSLPSRHRPSPMFVHQEAVHFVGKDHDLERHMIFSQALREIDGLAERHVAIVVALDQQHRRLPQLHRGVRRRFVTPISLPAHSPAAARRSGRNRGTTPTSHARRGNRRLRRTGRSCAPVPSPSDSRRMNRPTGRASSCRLSADV